MVEYGFGSRVAWIRVPAAPLATGAETASTPSTPSTAFATAATLPVSVTTTSVSAVVPEGKLLSTRCWPSVESTSVR